MGIEHIQNLLAIPGTEITGLADTSPESLAKALKLLKESPPENNNNNTNIQTFDAGRDLLKTRDLIDVVIIATPNYNHVSMFMQVLRYADRNLHIFVEKPLCTETEDCEIIMERSQFWKGLVWVGMEYRYMASISKLISEVRKGAVGKVTMASIREHRFPFLKKVENWNRFNENTGGTLVEKCCHFWDLFNRFLKPSMPVRVMASGSQAVNHLNEKYDGKTPDILDNAYVVVEYTCGARVMLDLCMFAESSMHQEEVVVVGPKGKVEAFIPQNEFRYGRRGRHSLGKVKVETVKDERVKFEGYHSGASYLEHLDLLKWVRSNGSTESLMHEPVTMWEGYIAVAVGVAAHQSIEEGRWVRMDEVITQDALDGKIKGG